MNTYMFQQHNYEGYKPAWNKAVETLKSKNPLEIALKSGADYDSDQQLFYLKSFGQTMIISYLTGEVSLQGYEKMPLFYWCLTAVNYLARSSGELPAKRLVSYKELDGGNVFYPALLRDSYQPFEKFVEDKQPEAISKAVTALGGKLTSNADVSACIYLFPKFPITLNIWLKDEEFGGSINLLFDANANQYLHTEDIAAVSDLCLKFMNNGINRLAQHN